MADSDDSFGNDLAAPLLHENHPIGRAVGRHVSRVASEDDNVPMPFRPQRSATGSASTAQYTNVSGKKSSASSRPSVFSNTRSYASRQSSAVAGRRSSGLTMSSTPSIRLQRRASRRGGPARVEDSDDDEDAPAHWRRRVSRHASTASRVGGRPSSTWPGGGGVDIRRRSQEWSGLKGLDDSSEAEEEVQESPNMLDRRQRYARMAKEIEARADPAEENKDAEDEGDRRKRGLRVCLVVVFLFLVYNAINGCLVYVLLSRHQDAWLLTACLAPSCAFVAVIEACLAWTDRDVARIRFQLWRKQAYVRLAMFQVFVVVVLGCCFGYHLVRAYRNFKRLDLHRTFLTEVEGLDPSRQALMGTVRWDTWDVIWGPPIIFSLTMFLARGRFSLAEGCFWFAILTIATISVAHDCTNYDWMASQHIRTQYGTTFDVTLLKWVHRANGAQSARRFQLAHFCYRATECAARALTVAALAAASLRLPRCVVALFVADFAAGAWALLWAQGYLPSLEALAVSVALFWADVVRFVDEPGFTYLAQRTSAVIEAMRFLEVCAAIAACAWMSGFDPTPGRPFEGPAALVVLFLLVAMYAAHKVVRISTKLGQVRGDIFTAVAKDSVDAIEESLNFEGGCTINMRICDGSKRTALHFAIARGKQACALSLIRRGADSNTVDDKGENALHLACRRANLAVATAILKGEGSSFRPKSRRQMNWKCLTPAEVLPRRAPPELRRLLEEQEDPAAVEAAALKSPPRAAENRSRAPTGEEGDTILNCPDSAALALPLLQDPLLAGLDDGRRRSWRESIFGAIAGGQHFHLWVGPRAQVGRMELASFMFSRGVGEEAERLLEHFQQRHSKIRLAYLTTICTLGAGGFGKVMKVRDVRTGDDFAMKLQKKDKAAKQAVREARELSDKRHPFIVELVHIFHTTVFYGILMEFCEMDLNVRIIEASAGQDTVAGLPLPAVARYTSCVALALEFLHSRKVLFRDLKPENVLLTSKERGDFAKLADFGMAKCIDWEQDQTGCARTPSAFSEQQEGFSAQSLTRSNESRLTLKAGTLAFMSGEAIDAPDDEEDSVEYYAKRDWYGLGCCLLLMLLGERGGRKLRHGKREVLLPAPQPEILSRLIKALEEELIDEQQLDLVSELTDERARDRGNSIQIRNSALCSQSILELEAQVNLFPLQ